jgi:hypothetical protein
LLQLHRALESHHEADQEVDENDDRDRVRSGPLHEMRDLFPIAGARFSQEAEEGEDHVPEKSEHLAHGPEERVGAVPDLLEGASRPPAPPPNGILVTAVEVYEFLHVAGRAYEIGADAAQLELVAQVDEKGHRAAIDPFDPGHFEVEPLPTAHGGQPLCQTLPQRGCVGELEVPFHVELERFRGKAELDARSLRARMRRGGACVIPHRVVTLVPPRSARREQRLRR